MHAVQLNVFCHLLCVRKMMITVTVSQGGEDYMI